MEKIIPLKPNLQRKLMFWVLLPMVVGMISTLLIAYLPFYLSFPSWINSITDEMINDRKGTLKIISGYLSLAAGSAISYPCSFLILSGELMKMTFNSTIQIKSSFTPYTNSINARLFQIGEIPPPYGFNASTNKSFETGMWYLGNTLYYNQMTNASDIQNLNLSGIFDFFIRPIVLAGNIDGTVIFQRSLTGFQNDGMVHAVPTEYQSYYQMFNSSNCSYNANRALPLYDPRCRPWYIMAETSTDPDIITITEPYLFADSTANIGQTLCASNWDGTNFRLASCIDYSMDQLSSYINTTDTGKTTYAFAVSPGDKTFVHPRFNNSCQSDITNSVQCLSNITTTEMTGASSAEISYFNKYILPLFSLNITSIGEYSVNGEKIIIAVSPVNTVVSLQKEIGRVASIGLRLEKRTTTEPFSELKQSLTELLMFEGIAMGVLIMGILMFCWVITRSVTEQIVKPLDDLVHILSRMFKGDLDINIKEHYQLCSKEITKLYTLFAKLKIVLRFGKASYFSEDSEAIMNYAQALELFLEFQDTEGAGICYNNLGFIHYKNHRHREAIECFEKALELAEKSGDKPGLVVKRKHVLANALLAWRTNNSRGLSLMLELIDGYKQDTADLSKAIDGLILLAEHAIRNSKDPQPFLEESEELLRRNSTIRVPREIFETKIMFCEGLLLAKTGQIRDACDVYIKCLVSSSVYEPDTRRKCLEELKGIYVEYSVPVEYIDYLVSDFQEPAKDIFFVVNYNTSMEGPKIKKVQENLIRILQSSINAADRVGYILFNNMCKITYNLIPKGRDCSELTRKIALWNSPQEGTAYYDAIGLAARGLDILTTQCENIVPFDEAGTKKMERIKWIIAIVDGEDDSSSITFEKIKQKLSSTNINLATIGIEIITPFQECIKEICNETQKGLYIDCPTVFDIDKAFHMLSVVISSKKDNIESLD